MPRKYESKRQETVDLNSASHDQLASLPMVDDRRADFIIENRPYNSWEDLQSVPGFSETMIEELKKGNAVIKGQKS